MSNQTSSINDTSEAKAKEAKDQIEIDIEVDLDQPVDAAEVSGSDWLAIEIKFGSPVFAMQGKPGVVDTQAVANFLLDTLIKVSGGEYDGLIGTAEGDHIASWTLKSGSANSERLAAKYVNSAASLINKDTTFGEFFAEALHYTNGERFVYSTAAAIVNDALEIGKNRTAYLPLSASLGVRLEGDTFVDVASSSSAEKVLERIEQSLELVGYGFDQKISDVFRLGSVDFDADNVDGGEAQ